MDKYLMMILKFTFFTMVGITSIGMAVALDSMVSIPLVLLGFYTMRKGALAIL